LEDARRASIHVRKIVFCSVGTRIGVVRLTSVLASTSRRDAKKPCVEIVGRAAKERPKRTFEESPIASWKARTAEGEFRMNVAYNTVKSSNILSQLKIVLNLVSMIPDVPSNLPKLHNKGCGPTFACVTPAEPDEMSFLNANPLSGNASFEESKPSDADAILSFNGFDKACGRSIRTTPCDQHFLKSTG
jgi:hypothetical protein